MILKLANDNELNIKSARRIFGPYKNKGITTYPLLTKMKIYDANKSFTIISNWKKKNTMVTSKGPVVPIKLARNVELLVASLQHIMWAIGNTNLFGTHLNPNVEGMGKIF